MKRILPFDVKTVPIMTSIMLYKFEVRLRLYLVLVVLFAVVSNLHKQL